jgi:metallo-beta-lactamase family protein
MHLEFFGAAGEVTGSCHIVRVGGRALLLDCGMIQGGDTPDARNRQPFPFDAARIDAVVLSHAHIDHSGYLPRLLRDGFRGPVYCTPGTIDLLRILLPDAAHLQEEEAAFANRHRTSRHDPALPLFTAADAERVLIRLERVPFGAVFTPAPGMQARFTRAGHILGAAIVECATAGRRLVFSGDLGRYDVPILMDPAPVPEADVLLVESTYGDRLHPPGDPAVELVAAVKRATAERGWLVIPAFAVGRAQEMLYELRRLEEADRVPTLPVYLDSPMGIQATVAYAVRTEEHDAEMRQVEAAGTRPFAPRRLVVSRSVEDSRRINHLDGPGIILAGSGMATGGRVLHHLKRLLPDPRTTVLLVGYQAAGTRGRQLQDGAREIKMLGETVAVRARVRVSDTYSAHADRGEILRWLHGFRRAPGVTYVVHGEPAAALALRDAIAADLGWDAAVAEDGQRVPV